MARSLFQATLWEGTIRKDCHLSGFPLPTPCHVAGAHKSGKVTSFSWVGGKNRTSEEGDKLEEFPGLWASRGSLGILEVKVIPKANRLQTCENWRRRARRAETSYTQMMAVKVCSSRDFSYCSGAVGKRARVMPLPNGRKLIGTRDCRKALNAGTFWGVFVLIITGRQS